MNWVKRAGVGEDKLVGRTIIEMGMSGENTFIKLDDGRVIYLSDDEVSNVASKTEGQKKEAKSGNLYLRDLVQTVHEEFATEIRRKRPDLVQALNEDEDIIVGDFYSTEEFQAS